MIETLQANIAGKILQHTDQYQKEFKDWKDEK